VAKGFTNQDASSSGPVRTCYMGRNCTEIVGFASLFDFCSLAVLSLHQLNVDSLVYITALTNS